MIERPIKRVLQGLSVVTVMGFGGYSLFHLSEALKLQAESREWTETNGAWYSAKCEAQLPTEMINRMICQEAWGRKAYYDYAPGVAMIEARNSLGIALIAPFLLLISILLHRLKSKR